MIDLFTVCFIFALHVNAFIYVIRFITEEYHENKVNIIQIVRHLFILLYVASKHSFFFRISHWDVNNEMLHGSYFADKLRPRIRDWMYKTVHKEDPNSKLFVNDFDVAANGIYTQVR